MSEYQLTKEIISRSVAKNWDAAKLEWKLDHIYESEEPGTCLCGHFPIKEFCIIRNIKNGALATVGNCCVNKFMGITSDKIFQSLRRVRKTPEKSLNAEAIQYAFDQGWINEWEKDFYLDILRKRQLSLKQQSKKAQINDKILHNFKLSK